MKLSLQGPQELIVSTNCQFSEDVPSGWTVLKVTHCGVCRTDAKMWNEGHRDLVIPRVLGHEIVVTQNGERYAVWPGISCKTCQYCQNGQENLCNDMRIIGFHEDGGFADTLMAPVSNLIPIPTQLSSSLATLAEPAGCIVNVLNKLGLQKNETVLIYGAGIMGLLAALMCLQYGATPLVVEKEDSRNDRALAFATEAGIRVVQDTQENGFNCVLNACADPAAFMAGISKAAKGARIGFFSGLNKSVSMDCAVLNTIHYREQIVCGAYGLTQRDMEKGIHHLLQAQTSLNLLIEKHISLSEVASVMPRILNGDAYKFVVQFRKEDLDN